MVGQMLMSMLMMYSLMLLLLQFLVVVVVKVRTISNVTIVLIIPLAVYRWRFRNHGSHDRWRTFVDEQSGVVSVTMPRIETGTSSAFLLPLGDRRGRVVILRDALLSRQLGSVLLVDRDCDRRTFSQP